MATYHFDSVLGSDSNSGLTESLPKQSFEAFTASAGDRLLFKRGTTQRIITTAEKAIVTGTPAAPTYYGAYGVAQVPYATLTKPAGAPGTTILNASFRRDYVVEDLFFDMAGTGYRSIYASATAAGNANGIRIRRCKFANAYGDIPGLYVGKENTTNTIFDVIVEECDFWNNGADGITVLAGTNVIVRKCRGWANGASGLNGGHNFRITSRQVAVSSGWTVSSGTIYQRNLAAHETDVFFVRHPSYPRMAKYTGGTPATSTPIGQFAVSGGVLYVNANANPNGSSMTYVWDAGRGVLIERCESWDSLWNLAAPFHEGHGMSFDDFASDSAMVGCVIRDSEGLGVSVNGGDNNRIDGCLIIRSEMRAVSLGSGVGNKVRNCTMLGNNSGRDASTSEVAGSATAADSEVRNSIIIGRGNTYGVYFDAASGCVASNNAIYGVTDAVFGGTESNAITYDPAPYLDSVGRLRAMRLPENPLASAGAYAPGVRLMGGKRPVPGRVPVGAYPEVRV